MVDLKDCLLAISNPIRFKIFKFLFNSKEGVRYIELHHKIYPDSKIKKNSSLNSHLKKLMDCKLIIKQNQKYFISNIAKNISEALFYLENFFEKINKKYMVRTSNFLVEPFELSKIVNFLINEGNLQKGDAQYIANIVREKLLNSNLDYLTAPLIREVVNSVLLENNFELVRRKLTRLGLPPIEVLYLLNSNNFENPSELFKEFGKHVFEQNLLLNILPIGNADYYLKGTIIINHPELWALLPNELIISGKQLGQLIIKDLKSIELPMKEIQIVNLYKSIQNVFHKLRQFFIKGVLVFEFEYLINEIIESLNIKTDLAVNYFFNSLPEINTYKKTDPRNIHNNRWELWLELDLSNQINFKHIIEEIINYYISNINKLMKKVRENNKNYKLYDKDFKRYVQDVCELPTLAITINEDIKRYINQKENEINNNSILKKILELSSYLNINFNYMNSSKKNLKVLLSPSLTPIYITMINFFDQKIQPFPQIVLDKITLNLPRILQISEDIDEFEKVTEPKLYKRNKEKFFKELLNWILNAINLFDIKFKEIRKNISKFKSADFIINNIFERKLFYNDNDLKDYNNSIKINCGITINGLIETVHYFTGFYPTNKDDSMQFCLEILDLVISTLKNNSKNSAINYIFSQIELDNILQEYFIRDSKILQNMSFVYEDIPFANYIEEFECFLSIYKFNNKKQIKNYDIDMFMEPSQKNREFHYLRPYWISLLRQDVPRNFENTLKLFKKFQNSVDYLYLDIFIKDFEYPNDFKQMINIFKNIIENDIRFFGFTRIIEYPRGVKYYRYASCYFPISDLEYLLQQTILKRKDEIDLISS